MLSLYAGLSCKISQFLAIRKTMQINSRPKEIIVYFLKQTGYLCVCVINFISMNHVLHTRVTVRLMGLGFVRLLS